MNRLHKKYYCHNHSFIPITLLINKKPCRTLIDNATWHNIIRTNLNNASEGKPIQHVVQLATCQHTGEIVGEVIIAVIRHPQCSVINITNTMKPVACRSRFVKSKFGQYTTSSPDQQGGCRQCSCMNWTTLCHPNTERRCRDS
ncbi:hypothetical protein PR048_012947 [Dryococelus australis]|uniref:Uncharacterized protein n=1 Tax=Dryococelus australis TaxID=614101 RepID=A0ABQ9HRH3_9NEOP|nr:hypothetical protein PR048_012947 [Dryococelus australis]